jgi:hypothetical protein
MNALRECGIEVNPDVAQVLWEEFSEECNCNSWINVPYSHEDILTMISELCALRIYEEIRSMGPEVEQKPNTFVFDSYKEKPIVVEHEGQRVLLGPLLLNLAPSLPFKKGE